MVQIGNLKYRNLVSHDLPKCNIVHDQLKYFEEAVNKYHKEGWTGTIKKSPTINNTSRFRTTTNRGPVVYSSSFGIFGGVDTTGDFMLMESSAYGFGPLVPNSQWPNILGQMMEHINLNISSPTINAITNSDEQPDE